MRDLDISIVNYKTRNLTEKCLKSIFSKRWGIKYQVWIVDNGSGDGSLEYLQRNFSRAAFIKSNKNLGYAGGHNLVLMNLDARYVLLLNSDTEVNKKTLDLMVSFMDDRREVGIASCKVLGYDNEIQPNGGDLPFGLSLIGWLFNLELFGINKPSFHREESSYYENLHEAGWVSGSFMMVRKEVFEKIGLLNEKYFMYFEDVDFCYRARKAGFKVMINSETSIKHLSGGSSDDPKFRQWLGEYKGLIRFYKNQFGWISALFVKLLIYISVLLRVAAFLLMGKVNYSKTYVKTIVSL